MKKSLFKPLPSYLIKRYKGWKSTTFEENKSFYQKLADEGQHPRSMVISCCDSRVQATSIFGADSGELFIHRNIANIVPPYEIDNGYHGTSAAIEYAIKGLKVSNIIVLGHSLCGGIQNILPHFLDPSKSYNDDFIFITRWLQILEPGYRQMQKSNNMNENLENLEKAGIVVSLKNLLSFPFVISALKEEKISLHGLWYNIKIGSLYYYNPVINKFKIV